MRISSRQDLRRTADRRDQPVRVSASNPIYRFLVLLRVCEYVENVGYPPALQKLARMLLRDERLATDVWYVDHRSLWLDLRVLVRTVGVVLGRAGVSAPGEATMAPFAGVTP
jgi:hypothetical protein